MQHYFFHVSEERPSVPLMFSKYAKRRTKGAMKSISLTSNSEESNFVICWLRSAVRPGTRIASWVCILIGVSVSPFPFSRSVGSGSDTSWLFCSLASSWDRGPRASSFKTVAAAAFEVPPVGVDLSGDGALGDEMVNNLLGLKGTRNLTFINETLIAWNDNLLHLHSDRYAPSQLTVSNALLYAARKYRHWMTKSRKERGGRARILRSRKFCGISCLLFPGNRATKAIFYWGGMEQKPYSESRAAIFFARAWNTGNLSVQPLWSLYQLKAW